MNRLKTLLIATALITGSSALASAEEHHNSGWYYQDRDHVDNRDQDRYGYGYYGYRDGDHDRDDRNAYRNDWRGDRDDRLRGRDRDDRRGDRDRDDRGGHDRN